MPEIEEAGVVDPLNGYLSRCLLEWPLVYHSAHYWSDFTAAKYDDYCVDAFAVGSLCVFLSQRLDPDGPKDSTNARSLLIPFMRRVSIVPYSEFESASVG
jgi:hypothetical protein